MSELRCHYCNRTNPELAPSDDLRPYGPGGAPMCYGCMTQDPARRETATKIVRDRLLKIWKAGDTPVIGNDLYQIEAMREKES